MDFKNLMHNLNKVSARILHTVEDVLPDNIQPVHYAEWDAQNQVVKGQDGRPVLPKEHRTYAEQVHLLLITIVAPGGIRRTRRFQIMVQASL